MSLLFSYLDAGTGSVVIQSLIGIVAGIGVFGRKFIASFGHRIRGMFSRADVGNHSDKP